MEPRVLDKKKSQKRSDKDLNMSCVIIVIKKTITQIFVSISKKTNCNLTTTTSMTEVYKKADLAPSLVRVLYIYHTI